MKSRKWLKLSTRALAGVAFLTLVIVGCRKEMNNQMHTTVNADGEVITWHYIDNQYIVVYDNVAIGEPQKKIGKNPVTLNNYVEGVTDQMMRETGLNTDDIQVLHVYGNAIAGFAAVMSEDVANQLKSDPRVKSVEKDVEFTIDARGGKPGAPGSGGSGGSTGQTTPWGIPVVGGVSSYTGSGVAWIIDTGIDLDHPDLIVDVTHAFSAFTTGKDAGFDDGNGHGTHVSGTIAAIDNDIDVIGVAPGATVIPVKVLSSRGSGSYSGVIAGVNHVAAYGHDGDVANMSLGGPVSTALDLAVLAASAHVKFAIAAGNDGKDAAGYSPAHVNGSNVYTISAMDSKYNFASWSNWGDTTVDYCAPGVSILSLWKGGGTNTISGTSMATPHAAGVLLLGTPGTNGLVNNDPDNNTDYIIHHN